MIYRRVRWENWPSRKTPLSAAYLNQMDQGIHDLHRHILIESQFTVPVGAIIMWAGSEMDIPAGWVLCNGDHGTPDLRNRFVVGAGVNHTRHDTGGNPAVSLEAKHLPGHAHSPSPAGEHTHGTQVLEEADLHDHELEEAGEHKHEVFSREAYRRQGYTDETGEHTHRLDITRHGSGGAMRGDGLHRDWHGGDWRPNGKPENRIRDRVSGCLDLNSSLHDRDEVMYFRSHKHSFEPIEAGGHVHQLPLSPAHGHDPTTSEGAHNHGGVTEMTGDDEEHNNMPPYYALCYIMRVPL